MLVTLFTFSVVLYNTAPKKNETQKSGEIFGLPHKVSLKTRTKIKEFLALEYELYEYVKARFFRQLRAFGIPIKVID